VGAADVREGLALLGRACVFAGSGAALFVFGAAVFVFAGVVFVFAGVGDGFAAVGEGFGEGVLDGACVRSALRLGETDARPVGVALASPWVCSSGTPVRICSPEGPPPTL
jgi:hypothetical protein